MRLLFCIRQGLDYFRATENTPISTSPLLIYYGMLSLSKALLVANVNNIFIDNIKYHGLSTRPITNELSNFRSQDDDWRFENEYAVVKDGVFKKLNKAISPNNILENNSIFYIKNTLSCVPEMKEIYEKFYLETANSLDMYSDITMNEDGRVSFALSCQHEGDILEQREPLILENFTKSVKHSYDRLYISNGQVNVEDIDYLYAYQAFVGGRYFVLRIPYKYKEEDRKVSIQQILLDYINLFILSEQVRYHQNHWASVINGNNNGVISLIELYIDIVKRRFPNMILNYIFNELFIYGVPARLG